MVVPLEIVIVGMRVIPSPKLGYFNRCSKEPWLWLLNRHESWPLVASPCHSSEAAGGADTVFGTDLGETVK